MSQFPNTLYVMEPLGVKPYEGYETLEGCEEDDTVAVYSLQRVCRIKIQKSVHLVDEAELAR